MPMMKKLKSMQILISEFYQYGHGSINIDLVKALGYYKNAEKLGHKDAKSQIVDVNKLIASNNNNKTINKSILYCENEKGQVYSLSKSIYKSCGYREISKQEFNIKRTIKQLLKNKLKNKKLNKQLL